MQEEGVWHIVSLSQLVVLLRHYSEAGVLVRSTDERHVVAAFFSKSWFTSSVPWSLEDSQHFGTMKGLEELLAGGNVVYQLKHFL